MCGFAEQFCFLLLNVVAILIELSSFCCFFLTCFFFVFGSFSITVILMMCVWQIQGLCLPHIFFNPAPFFFASSLSVLSIEVIVVIRIIMISLK